MEPGESVTECMEREVWEETGLTVESSNAVRSLFRTEVHGPDAAGRSIADGSVSS